jgi:hypothetical protein
MRPPIDDSGRVRAALRARATAKLWTGASAQTRSERALEAALFPRACVALAFIDEGAAISHARRALIGAFPVAAAWGVTWFTDAIAFDAECARIEARHEEIAMRFASPALRAQMREDAAASTPTVPFGAARRRKSRPS